MSGKASHGPGGCEKLLKELFDYLDGDLSPGRCAALELHLSRCPCCGEMADNLRKAIAVCRAEGQRTLPLAVRTRARRRVAALMKGELAAPTTRKAARSKGARRGPGA